MPNPLIFAVGLRAPLNVALACNLCRNVFIWWWGWMLLGMKRGCLYPVETFDNTSTLRLSLWILYKQHWCTIWEQCKLKGQFTVSVELWSNDGCHIWRVKPATFILLKGFRTDLTLPPPRWILLSIPVLQLWQGLLSVSTYCYSSHTAHAHHTQGCCRFETFSQTVHRNSAARSVWKYYIIDIIQISAALSCRLVFGFYY